MRLTPLVRGTAAVLLLLPWTSAAQAAHGCALDAPSLDADLVRACETVRAAVPSWDGGATVRLVPGDAAVAGESYGRSVALHQAAWDRLTPQGRQVVLTHELVHVATNDFTTAGTPGWLVEGYAEAVALRGSRLPDQVLLRELASDGAPTALPSDLGGEPAAYEASWLALDLLLRTYGGPAVLQLYRDAGTRPLPDALAALGLSVPELTAAWRAEVARRLS